MMLPNIESVRVDKKKLEGYLLSEIHPEGAGKAAFFKRFGYTSSVWMLFRKALCQHALMNEVFDVVESEHGTRYVVRCKIPVLKE